MIFRPLIVHPNPFGFESQSDKIFSFNLVVDLKNMRSVMSNAPKKPVRNGIFNNVFTTDWIAFFIVFLM